MVYRTIRSDRAHSPFASVVVVTIISSTQLTEQIRALPPHAGATRVVAIDGPAGAGTSVFAARLGRRLGAPTVCLDDLTPSWTGPDREAPLLVEQVLAPLAAGTRARYHYFDWVLDRYTEWRSVPAEPVLIVEGVGAGSRIVRPYVSFLVWVEAPSQLRLERGLARDGANRLHEWQRWRAREEKLFKREGTRHAAMLLIDGAPRVPHDPDTAFVAIERDDVAPV